VTSFADYDLAASIVAVDDPAPVDLAGRRSSRAAGGLRLPVVA
jgi:hypothetical protein